MEDAAKPGQGVPEGGEEAARRKRSSVWVFLPIYLFISKVLKSGSASEG